LTCGHGLAAEHRPLGLMRLRAGFSPHSGRTHTGSAFFYADDRLPAGFPIFGKAFREREILLRVGLAVTSGTVLPLRCQRISRPLSRIPFLSNQRWHVDGAGKWDRILALCRQERYPNRRRAKKTAIQNARQRRPGGLRVLGPRPPLRDFTKEMDLILTWRRAEGCVAPESEEQKPNPPAHKPIMCGRVVISRFLRSQPRRIGLGHPLGRDPARTIDKLPAPPAGARKARAAEGIGHWTGRSSPAGRLG
jgi:hypothetical protein